MTYSYTYEGTDIKGEVIITLKDGIAYVFLYTAEEGTYAKYSDGFELISTSLKISE